ncbi:MAG: hypothetical protein FJZ62_03850 [Chlamydiae bacterium]|nr:hypothetical protein [Chlamydiota bacterium]
MPINIRKTAGKFPLEELIEQCNKAVETVEETVIGVGKTFETSDSKEINAVIQSPLTILERNIEKLREVQNVVEEILKIKEEPLCGTKFTKRQVTDATFRCVDYLAAFVAVALIIMETSDTAAKYLGETDVPKGFTAALVMVSKVLSALMDHRRKQELERQKFLAMLKDVQIKCDKIEEFAAIYNVFRSISVLKNEANLSFDQKSNCKEAVKILKSMPEAKIKGDLAKNLKKQLSTAIEDQAKDLIQERFRTIFDRNKPINVKRRLFDRWYNAYIISNRMSKIYKHNRFMLLENQEKLQFSYKQWAMIILKRKRVLERSKELLCRSPASLDEPQAPYGLKSSYQKFTSENPTRLEVFQGSSSQEGAGVFGAQIISQGRRSIDSQSLGSQEGIPSNSSSDEKELVASFREKTTPRGAPFVRRARSQRTLVPISGYMSGSSESGRSFLSSQERPMDPSRSAFPNYGMVPFPYDPRFSQMPLFFHNNPTPMRAGAEGLETQDLNGLRRPGCEDFSSLSQRPQLFPVQGGMQPRALEASYYYPYPAGAYDMTPQMLEMATQKERTAQQFYGSRRSSVSSVDKEVAQERLNKEVIHQGNFTIESSFVYASKQEDCLSTSSQSQVEPIRLNLPPVFSISNSVTGENTDHVVVQMPEKGE